MAMETRGLFGEEEKLTVRLRGSEEITCQIG